MQNETKEQHIERRIGETFGEMFREASLGRIESSGIFEHVQEWIKNPKGIILMHGEPGTGKTYFCAAMFSYLFDRFKSCRIYEEAEILRKLRSGMNESSSGDYSSQLISLIDDELIIIDDLGASGHNAWREEVMLCIVDYRLKNLKPTIFTTNLTPKAMYGIYNPRLISRLFSKQNLILESGKRDYRRDPIK